MAADVKELEARVGKVLKGKWTLERLIGAGGMAAVYAAKHEIGRKEAIKILHPHVAKDDELVARFKREAHAVNRFEHPAAVEIRDVDVTDEGEPFLVMELLEGESLARKIKRDGPLGVDETLHIADQLLDVLAAAHDKGVIHRDIKPSNLFIDDDGKLRVLDFGVAHFQRAPGTLVTEAGTQLGTVAYMPPEQLKGDTVDHRADIYAVGATLFRLLSGEKTHAAASEDELARKILTESARPLGKVSSKIPDEVCAIVDRALCRKPAERYPDAATMRTDIRAAIDGEDPPYASDKSVKDAQVHQPARATEVSAADENDEAKGDDDASADEAAAADAKRPAGKTVPMESPEKEDDVPRAGKKVAATIADDDATTVKRGGDTVVGDGDDAAVGDDDPTRVKGAPASKARRSKREGAVAKQAAAAQAAEPERAGGSGPMWLLLIAAVALVAWFALRGRETEETPAPILPTDTTTVATDAPTTDTTTTAAELTTEGEGGGSAAPPPRPGTQPPNIQLPSQWPSSLPLPSGFPTSFPTAIPTSLPTSFPTAIPSAFLPKTKPPPPPPPPPPSKGIDQSPPF